MKKKERNIDNANCFLRRSLQKEEIMEPLVARKRTYHDTQLYWIGRGKGKGFLPYRDMLGPTGYGFKSKAKAEQIIIEIENRLKGQGV